MPISAGVSHCSLLRPALFNVYMNDIKNIQNDNNNVATLLFVDHTNVTIRSGSIKLATNKLTVPLKC
jgi:hypothetical protein